MTDDTNDIPPTTPEQPAESGMPSLAAEGDTLVVAQKRGPGLHIATVVGILALLAAGVFAFVNLSGSKGGGGTPEEAVRALLDAASNEDFIGILQQLEPGERDAFREPLEQIRNELVRLGALKKNADLSGFPGIDISFSNVRLKTETVGEDVSLVRFTGGTSTVRTDPAKLPLGDIFRDAAGDALDKPTTETDEIGTGDDDYIVTVRRDGRWYTSLFYTIAESARREANAPVPDFGNAPPPRGADSAEQAVDDFLRSLGAFDIQSVISLMPPDEMAALHDYSTLFVNEARAAVEEFGQTVKVTVTQLDLGSKSLEEGASLVFIEKIGVRVATPDGTFTANYDGECLTTTGAEEFLPPRVCGDDLRENTPEAFQFARGEQGFVVVRRNGNWYISPTRTILEAFVSTLKAMKPGDLEKLADFFQDLGMGFAEGFSSSSTLTG